MANDNNANNFSGDENPWESAANDQQWNRQQQQQEEETTEFINHNNISAITTASTTATTTQYQQHPSSQSSLFWKFPYSMDMLLSLLVGGYIAYRLIVDNKQKEYFIAGCCWFGICVLGVIRGMFASGLRPTGSKFLLHLIYQSHWLASLIFGIASITIWIMYLLEKRPPTIPYIDEFLFWSQTEYPKALPSILLAISIWEGLRYLLVKCFVLDNNGGNNSFGGGGNAGGNTTIGTPHSRRSIPWWWNHQQRRQHNNNNNQQNDPLLDATGNPNWTHEGRRGNNNHGYYEDHGIETTSSRSWWPFGGGSRRGNNNGNNNPRDDGSVDYASLSEDWASRSQDDPLWWSRDDNNNGGGGGVPSTV